ncbi:C39 family peptidase [Corynebacterium mastitidis]|uniref:C39 family peptidase n=1 Tax=Corynebacterium mastitidis TaxID=161890 RepID=A0ABU8NVZ0_9CORY
MLPHVKRTLTAAALAASISATGLAGPVQAGAVGLDDVASWAASAAKSGTNAARFHYIKQDQGQENQWSDCGPASMLMALLDNGGSLPASYTRASQGQAMTDLRKEAPSAGNVRYNHLTDNDIVAILAKRGVPGTVYGNGAMGEVINQLKAGKKAIVLTQTGLIPNEKGDPGFGHFVYVSGYNKRTNTFTVNDPLKREERAHQVSDKELLRLITTPAEGNSQWALVI